MLQNQGFSAPGRGVTTIHVPEPAETSQNANPAAPPKRRYAIPELLRLAAGRAFPFCGFHNPAGMCRLEAGHAGYHHIPIGKGIELLACDCQGSYCTHDASNVALLDGALICWPCFVQRHAPARQVVQ